MDLDADLRTLSLSLDADYFGVADLAPAHDAILAQGGERVARYPRAVTIGMRLQDSFVDLLPDNDKAAAILYKHNSYDVVNLALDQLALRVANTLRRAGFDAAACDRYFKEMEREKGVAVCGLCLYICPHGRNAGKGMTRR